MKIKQLSKEYKNYVEAVLVEEFDTKKFQDVDEYDIEELIEWGYSRSEAEAISKFVEEKLEEGEDMDLNEATHMYKMKIEEFAPKKNGIYKGIYKCLCHGIDAEPHFQVEIEEITVIDNCVFLKY